MGFIHRLRTTVRYHAFGSTVPTIRIEAANEIERLEKALRDMTDCSRWPVFSHNEVEMRACDALKG